MKPKIVNTHATFLAGKVTPALMLAAMDPQDMVDLLAPDGSKAGTFYADTKELVFKVRCNKLTAPERVKYKQMVTQLKVNGEKRKPDWPDFPDGFGIREIRMSFARAGAKALMLLTNIQQGVAKPSLRIRFKLICNKIDAALAPPPEPEEKAPKKAAKKAAKKVVIVKKKVNKPVTEQP